MQEEIQGNEREKEVGVKECGLSRGGQSFLEAGKKKPA